jgi:hypothetical protein
VDEELAEAVVESITFHFAVGNAGLTPEQFGQHLAHCVCPACSDDANLAILLRGELAVA